MTKQLGLLGDGLVHDAIARALGRCAVEMSPDGVTPHVAALVVASDAWNTSDHAAVRALAESAAIPWLPVWTELGEAIIGPLETPGRPGCADCAAKRRRRIQVDRAERVAVYRRHSDELTSRPSPWLTGLAADLVAALVVADVERVIDGDDPHTRCALYRVQLAELSVDRHAFLPDPICRVCGDLPVDDPQQAQITMERRLAHTAGGYRVRALGDELTELTATYVDEMCGLVRTLDSWTRGALVNTAAPLGWRRAIPVAGFGVGTTFEKSKITALLEALERYASAPGGRRTVVTATYEEIRDRCLDPRELGLFSREQYELPGFAFRPFEPDQPYQWVWGWSFARQGPILVPEHCGYYNAPHNDTVGHRFIYEISNGCAIGSCLEEAILFGILEVAERDAFLMTWYAQLPAPRIDMGTASGRTQLLAASVEAETGYQVQCFDIRTEQGIPCVWAMAVNPSDDRRPSLAVAAGCHPMPDVAVRRALEELGPSLANLIRRYHDSTEAERAREMVADATRVQEMDDHVLVYADPGAAHRLDFLRNTLARTSVADMESTGEGGFASDDLRDNVLEAVSRYADCGMDVIVVDQTTPEHRAGNFACVKVLIPGTLPMTFGQHQRRVNGLSRLYDVPRALGYLDRPLRPNELNPHPHPFP